MSLFNQASNETQLSRATRRARRILLAFTAALVIGATGYVFVDVVHQLMRLASFNRNIVTWSFSQVEVETLKLQRAVIDANAHPQDPERLKALRLQFDIMYSRLNAENSSDRLDDPSIGDVLRADLLAKGAFFDRVMPLIDGPDSALVAALPALQTEMSTLAGQLRKHIVESLQDLIGRQESQRNDLRLSLQLFAGAAVVLTAMLGGFAAVIAAQNRAKRQRAAITERAMYNLRTAIEHSLDAIVIADHFGIITDCNPAAEALFGFHQAEARGHFLADLFGQPGAADADVNPKSFRYSTDGARLREGRMELIGCHHDGRQFPIEVALTEAKGAMGEPMTIAFVRDLSERLEREETMRKARNDALMGEEAKSRFLAVMSHEMRTPLNGLIAAAELLQNSTALDQRQSWLAEIVHSCGLAALDQVNNVLELTRLGSDKTGTYPASAFSPLQAIRELMEQNQPQASKRSNVLHIVEPDHDVPYVLAPRQLFMRVLYNLVGNAVKFSDGGSVTVSLETESIGDSIRIVVSVTDTGIGIAEADLERIFHSFETLDDSYARMREGTGLGLGIAKLSAEAMGGEIRVSSKLGEGSTFVLDVTLPVVIGPAHPPRVLPPERAASGALSILVVEDNPINSMLLTEMLRLRGHEVSNAVDGLEAVAATRSATYDLILMDISMPRMDGLEATRRIRADSLCRTVPIIGVTANASPEKMPEFLGAGMSDVLVKPITRGALVHIIEEHLTAIPLPDPAPLDVPVPPINAVFEETVKDLGHEVIQVLADRMLSDPKAIPDSLRKLVIDGKLPEAAAAAHKKANSAAAIGLGALANALLGFEQAARADDIGACGRAIALIGQIIPQTAQALRERRQPAAESCDP